MKEKEIEKNLDLLQKMNSLNNWDYDQKRIKKMSTAIKVFGFIFTAAIMIWFLGFLLAPILINIAAIKYIF